jgi:hypothetical protein
MSKLCVSDDTKQAIQAALSADPDPNLNAIARQARVSWLTVRKIGRDSGILPPPESEPHLVPDIAANTHWRQTLPKPPHNKRASPSVLQRPDF